MENWWLDEIGFVGDEHLDAEYVAGYDVKAQFDPGPDIALLRQFGLDESSTVIDLGAGTGTFAAAAAETGASIVAVDPSPAMVRAIRAKTQALPNVTVEQAGMLSYEHDGGADFVYSRHVLHQLPDFWKVMALLRIGAMLRGGGTFVLRDLVFDTPPQTVSGVLNEWMDSAGQDPAAGYTQDDLVAHVASEFSTFTWLLEEALDRTGFAVIEKDVNQGVYARYVCRLSHR